MNIYFVKELVTNKEAFIPAINTSEAINEVGWPAGQCFVALVKTSWPRPVRPGDIDF